MSGMPRSAVSVVAYTYGGMYRECFDVKVAREVASACGQSHHVLPLGPDFFSEFGKFAEQTVWLTDGTLDLCGTHEVYYSALARQLSVVRLTGNYGSELLRSASTFKFSSPSQTLFDREVVASTLNAEHSFLTTRARHPVTFAAFQEIPWNLFGRLAAAQTQLVVRSPFMDNDLVKLLYRAPPSALETNDASWCLVTDLDRRLAQIPTDMGYSGSARTPLAATRRFLRYLLFKAEWYYNTGMPDWLARVDRTIPLKPLTPFFLGSHKIDHYRLWFRDEASDFIRTLLTDQASKSRSYLNPRAYQQLLKAHLAGRGNSLRDVNKVATLELIHRQLIERDYLGMSAAVNEMPRLSLPSEAKSPPVAL
jgi:asparagine synthase (glutamine-hydrolysing)